MVADPEMWNAFVGHLEETIARHCRELAPYKGGVQFVSRMAGGEKVDITAERIQQIEQEIQGLRNTLARVRQDYP